jgi:2-dehydro-3-deoxygluconokinase
LAGNPQIVAVGEPLVAFVGRTPNVPLHEIDGYGAHVVGAELNAAIGLARLGHRVAFVGRVGADPFGVLIRRRLLMEGVETRWLTDDERPTGLLFRNLRTTAPPEVVYRRGGSAGSTLTFAQVEPALARLAGDGVVLVSGVTAAICPQTVREVIRAARDAGLRICLDLNYRSRLWPAREASAALRSLPAAADLVVGSALEARLLTGSSDLRRSAQALLGSGAGIVVLRHDESASSWYGSVTAEPVTVRRPLLPAVDPVGAGDAFMAGLVSALLELGPGDPAACLTRGHLCGTAVIDTVGDIEGALHRHELSEPGAEDRGVEPLR